MHGINLQRKKFTGREDFDSICTHAAIGIELLQPAGRNRHLMGLIVIDLDNFKQINDSFGHTVGDKILRSFAGRMLSLLRKSDTVSRIGGDEFVILIPKIEREEFPDIVLHKIADGAAPEELIKNADTDTVDVWVWEDANGNDDFDAGEDESDVVPAAGCPVFNSSTFANFGYNVSSVLFPKGWILWNAADSFESVSTATLTGAVIENWLTL